ncbi:MAG: acyl-ACP--UDP-N-acetylglucosamine O-acyltransferase [Hyphomicrobiaceae bacterium]|nr:acyl-ACP--UDP-N-acetylglucosamine O-acyltransferase [Hyphomicrobiaceae bacterium]
MSKKAKPAATKSSTTKRATAAIHPTAIVDKGAEIGAGVEIGPFCHIGAKVKVGDGVKLISHVVLAGRTTIGNNTRIFPFASLGHEPQDLKYKGEATTLTIGANCTIREGVTMNPGTAGGGNVTFVGDGCTFLANSHVGHDCRVGSHVIFSNNVMLAGHCTVGDFVIIGGGAGVHQFSRIGHHAFIGGLAGVENDVIPYGMALGNRAGLAGLNIIGMKRLNFNREQIHNLRQAYRLLFSNEGTLAERLADVEDDKIASDQYVREILNFIKAPSDRSICMPRQSN